MSTEDKMCRISVPRKDGVALGLQEFFAEEGSGRQHVFQTRVCHAPWVGFALFIKRVGIIECAQEAPSVSRNISRCV